MTPASPHEAALLDWIIAREGSAFTDDPDDPGGATRYGITARTLGHLRRLGRDATAAEAEALTEAQARELYLGWLVRGPSLHLNLLPRWAAVPILDAAVLFGEGRAARWAQAAAGVTTDGVLGPRSLPAIAATEPAAFIGRMQDLRTDHHARRVAADPSQARFLKGWLRRSNLLTALLAA